MDRPFSEDTQTTEPRILGVDERASSLSDLATCTTCSENKSALTGFRPNRKNPSGRNKTCEDCLAWQRKKPEDRVREVLLENLGTWLTLDQLKKKAALDQRPAELILARLLTQSFPPEVKTGNKDDVRYYHATPNTKGYKPRTKNEDRKEKQTQAALPSQQTSGTEGHPSAFSSISNLFDVSSVKSRKPERPRTGTMPPLKKVS